MALPDTRFFEYLVELDGRTSGRPFRLSGPVLGGSGGHGSVDPFTLEIGAGMSRDFYRWISGAFERKGMRRSGVITAFDQTGKPVARTQFYDALLSEVTFPTLDAGQKTEAFLKVKFQPERLRTDAAPPVPSFGVYQSSKVKAWDTGHFRLELDGLDEARFVNHIDSFTVKQGIKSHYVGQDRYPQIEPTSLNFPNLSVQLPRQYANGFSKWWDDTQNDMQNDKHNAARFRAEKSGSLRFFGPGSSDPYFSLNLYGVGIVGISPKNAAVSAQPLEVDLYCQSMTFDAGFSAIK